MPKCLFACSLIVTQIKNTIHGLIVLVFLRCGSDSGRAEARSQNHLALCIMFAKKKTTLKTEKAQLD